MTNYDYIGVSLFNTDFWLNLILVIILSLVLLFIFLLLFNRRMTKIVDVYDIDGNTHEEEYICENGVPQHNVKKENKQ